MTLEDIKKELQSILDKLEGEDLSEDETKQLEDRIDELEKEQKSLETKAELRKKTLNAIASGVSGQEIEKIETRKKAEIKDRESILASKEYRNAFLKHFLREELKPEERVAFTGVTTETSAPLPTKMLDEVWNLVKEEHSILEDITIYKTGTILEIEKHVAVLAGKAKKVNEKSANDNTKYDLVKVTLSGNDFSKTVEISYASKKMSLNAFESYIINNISDELGEAMANDVIEQIKSDVSEENVVQPTVLNYLAICDAFSKLKKAKNIKMYVNNEALYKSICGIVDNEGHPIFQVNPNGEAVSVVLGATIRKEDGVSSKEILIGDSKKVVMNVIEDILLEDDKDISKHKYIYSGYARAESVLMYDKSFVLLDLTKCGTTAVSPSENADTNK